MTLNAQGRKCGTLAGYVAGCRCDECRAAKWKYGRLYRQGIRVRPVSVPEVRTRGKQAGDPNLVDADMTWMDGAPCIEARKQGVTFFPTQVSGPPPAVRVCCGCDRIERCLDFAIANHELGIWGGTTERERSRLRGNRR